MHEVPVTSDNSPGRQAPEPSKRHGIISPANKNRQALGQAGFRCRSSGHMAKKFQRVTNGR